MGPVEGEKRTKVSLIAPPWVLGERVKRFENVVSVQQPLGLAYLAAALEKDGHEVQLIDAAVQMLDDKQIVRELREFDPAQSSETGTGRVQQRT